MAGSNSRLPQAVSFDENLGLEIVAIHPDSGNLAQLVPTRPAARNETLFGRITIVTECSAAATRLQFSRSSFRLKVFSIHSRSTAQRTALSF
jgi:hypothetical protein